MSDLLAKVGAASTWGLSFSGPEVAASPLSAFGASSVDLTVTLVEVADIPRGVAQDRQEIHEWSGVYELTKYEFGGMTGVQHSGGGNWVLWTPDLKRVFVSRTDSPARDWIHARFLLRHFAVAALLARPGHRQMHAVAASVPGTREAVLIAGSTASGKTTLMNRLLHRGVLEECLEDDCVVVSPEWTAIGLMPLEREFRRSFSSKVKLVIGLENSADASNHGIDASRGFSFQAPWPASWLPTFGDPPAEPPSRHPPPTYASFPPRCADDPLALLEIERLIGLS